MEIRKSTPEDIPAILHIFSVAKQFMIAQGNATQWGNGYPGLEDLEPDIRSGNSYVIVDQGAIVGTFSFIIGTEPNYQNIKDGAWHDSRLYGTIHRLASGGSVKGIAKACFAYCSEQIDYLRIDTHKNNLSMQAAIQKFGFRQCGIIYVEDGTERIAYDYRKA